MTDVMSQMPQYQSHKKVWALQIDDAVGIDGCSMRLTFRDPGFAPRDVPNEVVSRYMPKPGDYLVQYDDGYLSISPQGPFEAGYSRVA